jgi:hypothetical protein
MNRRERQQEWQEAIKRDLFWDRQPEDPVVIRCDSSGNGIQVGGIAILVDVPADWSEYFTTWIKKFQERSPHMRDRDIVTLAFKTGFDALVKAYKDEPVGLDDKSRAMRMIDELRKQYGLSGNE